jgi:hypothetical protein
MEEWRPFWTRLGISVLVLAFMVTVGTNDVAYLLWFIGTICYANLGTWRKAE